MSGFRAISSLSAASALSGCCGSMVIVSDSITQSAILRSGGDNVPALRADSFRSIAFCRLDCSSYSRATMIFSLGSPSASFGSTVFRNSSTPISVLTTWRIWPMPFQSPFGE